MFFGTVFFDKVIDLYIIAQFKRWKDFKKSWQINFKRLDDSSKKI